MLLLLRVPRRALLPALVGALALVGTLAHLAARATQGMADARRMLLEGRAEAAAARYRGYAGWPRIGPEARAGLELARVLHRESAAVPAAVAAEARRFDLVALRALALQDANWPALVALGELQPDDPQARGLAAAAELELGREDAARARLAPQPSAAWLAPGLAEALAARAAGARTLLRDRRGTLVGWLDADGRAVGSTPEIAELMPLPALAGEGRALRLSLDRELSRLARRALGAHRGSIVLLDVATGGVLAAVSDPRTTAAEGGIPAFEQRREPASISKLVTTVATLRAGLDADAEIATITCDQHRRYGPLHIWCSRRAGPLAGLAHALAISCNLAFADLAERIGPDAVVAELRRFGFDRPDAGPLRWGRVLHPEPAMLADLAIGLEATDITPLHAAVLGATFADGGLLAPSLVAGRDGLLGRTLVPYPPAAEEVVIERRWLPMLWRAMEAVTAEGGTAEGVDASFPVAMKTGTGATRGLGYHVNYVGVGPLPHPWVAFAVRVTGEGSSGRINRAAREVTATLLDGLAGAR